VKRDIDLIRLILLEVEKNENYMQPIDIQAEGYSPEQIAYHVGLLGDAGYLTLSNKQHLRGFGVSPKSLTWSGHEFLDATRSGTVWHQLKARLKDQSVSAPLAVIQQLAVKLVGIQLGLGDE
jgi:hypothetical protein